jgi:hypothetical protein
LFNRSGAIQGSAMKSGVGSTENTILFISSSHATFQCEFDRARKNKLTVEFAVGIVLNLFLFI